VSESYPYEAYCPHCRVSHPPGTRRCIHCGGAVMKERPAGGTPLRVPIDISHGPGEPQEEGVERDEADEAAPARRSSGPLRLAISLVWILAAVAITVYRACTGQ
jgi:hypothetical protein